MTIGTGRRLQLRVHRNYLLNEAEHFRDHKKGIPEWIKNSDDSYLRYEDTGVDFSHLPIILNISKNQICCLDFGGSTGELMIEHIPYYGSPDAATQGKRMEKGKVAGGHGNGGKYYALSQFELCEVMSYYNGKFTMLTLTPDGDYLNIENEKMSPIEAVSYLKLPKWGYFLGTGKDDLLEKIYSNQLNFFCWNGINPKDNKQITSKKSMIKIVTSICNHPQARSALKSRRVDILCNGVLFWPELKPTTIDFDKSFDVKKFNLPSFIGDDKFNKESQSVLKIYMSQAILTGEKSSHNILEIDANGRNIAYYNLPNFMIDKGYSRYIYAHIDCPELREYKCVSNDREELIKNEASNNFLSWCKERLQEVIDDLSAQEKEKEQVKDLDDLKYFFQDIMDEVSDLLEEDDIIKYVYDDQGNETKIVLKG